MSYLVQSPFGVSEEGDAVSLSDTDSHSSETSSCGVPHSFSFQRCPACHWTGSVVSAAGICLQGILQHKTTTQRLVSWFVLYCYHFELFIDVLYLSGLNASRLLCLNTLIIFVLLI